LGRHNLHGFRYIPKKSLLLIRLMMNVKGARFQAFAPLGVYRAFDAPSKEARPFD
jgi:hypothetical protein